MLETIFYCALIFIGGVLFGVTLISARKDEDELFTVEEPVIDSYLDNKMFDPLRKTGIYLTDTLLEELCEAVSDDMVDLPSFGTINLKDANQLKQIYWRAVDTDETIYNG